MKIVKGSTIRINSVVYSDNGITVASIVGATITAMFKKSHTDLDSAAVLVKTVGSGVTITDGVNGACETLLAAADTNGLSYTRLYFELLVKLSNGEHIRSGITELELEPNVVKTLN